MCIHSRSARKPERELVAGRVPNQITVAPEVRAGALVALERMLALPAGRWRSRTLEGREA